MESMMALSSNIADNVAWKLMIKNTFIEIETPRRCAEPRSKSAPASSRFLQDDACAHASGCIVKLRSHIDSDVALSGNPEFFTTAMQPSKLNLKAPLFQS